MILACIYINKLRQTKTMYVTRPLSLYRNNPGAASDRPPAGPSSGYLVIQDEEAVRTRFFGLCEDTRIRNLPFPQNKDLDIRYTTRQGERSRTHSDDVILIPVVNEPLSSNRYYAIEPHGRHIGEAHGNLKDEDKAECLCFRFTYDVDPVPLDPSNIYQQFVIHPYETLFSSGMFSAKSVAPDGHPPNFLKRKGWRLYGKTPKRFFLGEAPGIFDESLRARLPGFDFPLTGNSCSESVLVGKWYCPFMFVRDGSLRDQIKTSMYYEMTLQQRWDPIYGRENNGGEDIGTVLADVKVKINYEVGLVAGKAARRGGVDGNGVAWFVGEGGESYRVGLSSAVVERMRWEVERFGWVDGGDESSVDVNAVKGSSSMKGVGNEWKRFGCYVLVERFVLKRMDGSVVLAYDFSHTNHVRCKWE